MYVCMYVHKHISYRLQSCALVDNPLQLSPRHFNQNFSSEFFKRFGSLPFNELPGISSSVKNGGPYTRVFARDAIFCCLWRWPSMPRFRVNSAQTIRGGRHFGIKRMINSFSIKYVAENDEERVITGNIFLQRIMRYS